MSRINKEDGYVRPIITKTDKLTPDDIEEQLEDYKTEDIYNEYQFFELFMNFDPAGDKDIYHKILNNYLFDGWIIVEQIEKPHNKSAIILRKKI